MLIVYHKKIIKLIELKNIGDTMGVFHLSQRALFAPKYLPEMCGLAGKLFDAWDEENGVTYHFLPYFPIKEIEKKAEILQQLGIPLNLSATEKGILTVGEGSTSLEDL